MDHQFPQEVHIFRVDAPRDAPGLVPDLPSSANCRRMNQAAWERAMGGAEGWVAAALVDGG